jgi:hypothetical protein
MSFNQAILTSCDARPITILPSHRTTNMTSFILWQIPIIGMAELQETTNNLETYGLEFSELRMGCGTLTIRR